LPAEFSSDFAAPKSGRIIISLARTSVPMLAQGLTGLFDIARQLGAALDQS
jgi:hypothetical protein